MLSDSKRRKSGNILTSLWRDLKMYRGTMVVGIIVAAIIAGMYVILAIQADTPSEARLWLGTATLFMIGMPLTLFLLLR